MPVTYPAVYSCNSINAFLCVTGTVIHVCTKAAVMQNSHLPPSWPCHCLKQTELMNTLCNVGHGLGCEILAREELTADTCITFAMHFKIARPDKTQPTKKQSHWITSNFLVHIRNLKSVLRLKRGMGPG